MKRHCSHSNQQNVSIHLYPKWGTGQTYFIIQRVLLGLDFPKICIILPSLRYFIDSSFRRGYHA